MRYRLVFCRGAPPTPSHSHILSIPFWHPFYFTRAAQLVQQTSLPWTSNTLLLLPQLLEHSVATVVATVAVPAVVAAMLPLRAVVAMQKRFTCCLEQRRLASHQRQRQHRWTEKGRLVGYVLRCKCASHASCSRVPVSNFGTLYSTHIRILVQSRHDS